MANKRSPAPVLLFAALMALLFFPAILVAQGDLEDTAPSSSSAPASGGTPPGGTPSRVAEGLINLEGSGMEVGVLLDAICAQSSFGYVLESGVSGKVSLNLKNATVDEALEHILLPMGLLYAIRGNHIYVFTRETADKNPALLPASNGFETRIFKLRNISASSIEDAVKTVLAGSGEIKIVPISVTRGWRVGEQVGDGGTSQAAGSLRGLDFSRSNQFLVRAEPSVLDEIETLVRELDTERQQVYISVVIFEMAVNEQEQIGFKWRISSTASGSALPWNFPFGDERLGKFSPVIDPSDDFAPAPGTRGLFPTIPGTSDASGDDGPFLFGLINMTGTELTAELNRLGADTNTVQNSKIMAMDQEEAVILVGERFPILRATVTDQGTVTEGFDRYEPIGTQLQVIPRILEDNAVELLLHPQVTQLGNVVVGTTGLTTPRINTREFQTHVKVHNKQSVVIAGLVSERVTENETQVPFLSRIPILGRIFRHTEKIVEKIDLVVVVTPYVDGTEDDQDMSRELESTGLSK